MRDRFSENADNVLEAAEFLAMTNGLSDVTPACVLLGILRSKRGVAHNILSYCKVDIDGLSSAITVEKPSEPKAYNSLMLDPDSTHALAFAKAEASRLGHRHIGSEHLLLGLLQLEESTISITLRSFGISIEAARRAALLQIGGRGQGDEL